MKYTKLGNSDLTVSRICMGCMGFGDPGRGQHSWTINEAHTKEIIKRGLELGVNFYDTAIAYQSGTSEQYVGRALRDFAKREDVVVATKFLPRTPAELEAGTSGQQHIENMINTSLKNLGMDYVDLYIYHMWDWNTPIEDIMDGLNRVVKAGKARYIGISNCFAWQIAKANALAEKEGFQKFVSVQGHYNLIFREEEREMVPYCNEENIALTPYSALASGRLSRLPGEGGTKRAEEDAYAKFKYDATAAQDNVCFNDLLSQMYRMEHGDYLYARDYPYSDVPFSHSIIPADLFESVIYRHFRISLDEFRERALYDAENDAYPWQDVNGRNIQYYPELIPEVTKVTENADGTVTLLVNVICPDKHTDHLFEHEVTMHIEADGAFQYLSNRIVYRSKTELPSPQARIEAQRFAVED